MSQANKIKIVLLSPYPDIQSFGLRTISSCLKKKGHDVIIVFLPMRIGGYYTDKTIDDVVALADGAGLIGISLMSNFFEHAIQLTQGLKVKGVNVPVIWGGIHPTLCPEECLNYADLVCIGEGETSIVQLVELLSHGKIYSDVPGIYSNAIPTDNYLPGPLLTDIDSIPFPDLDRLSHYVLHNNNLELLSSKLFVRYYGTTYTTMPTRGCPFECSYCCNNALKKLNVMFNKIRKRSVNNIIDELNYAKKHLPVVDTILFDDDAFFTYTVAEMEEFSREYISNIGLKLVITGATPTTITEDKLRLLVDAGLVSIRMGIQSGSNKIRKLYKRYYSDEQIVSAATTINLFKSKITLPQYDIILDNPWESNEDTIDTIKLIALIPPPFRLSLYSLTFYPGTELYDRAISEGIIANNKMDIYNKHYHKCKKTYLNGIVAIMNHYAINGKQIPSAILTKLTNNKTMNSKTKYIYYYLAKLRILPLLFQETYLLMKEALVDIRKGNWARIRNYINNYM